MSATHKSVRYNPISLEQGNEETTAFPEPYTLDRWPKASQKLGHKGLERYAGAIFDVLTTFLPVMFFGE